MFIKGASIIGFILFLLKVLINRIIPSKIDTRKTIFYIDLLVLILISLIVWLSALLYYIFIFSKGNQYNKNKYLEMILSVNGLTTIINIMFSLFTLIITIQIIVMLKNNFKIIIQDNEVFKNKTTGKSYLKNMIHVENKSDIETDIYRLKTNHMNTYSIKSYTMKGNENRLIEKIFVYNKNLWKRWKNISAIREDKKYSSVSLLMYLTGIFMFIILSIIITTLVNSEGNEWLFTILNLANAVVLIMFNIMLMKERTHINIRNLEDQKRYIEKEELKFY
ncbi:hypothetical protein [Mammaliicoccus sciuri]|uniref:hypothetical protein n=1 Tax=Mammaliicoccus sciuri TaxID=1296 RepID=UPI000878A292|nr:hypothetical protein [Mammaliicoccus sciuri]MEB6122665.1 hypothetical protein [Mammaliicoccus sciuri]MEB6312893.1 hypothetical protein [Mammaliicoccus sciuri]OFV60536.1 hypothetical protein BFX04_12610 [Mammaliicoccus sciuri]WQJ49766.1 hypothetical protein P3U25_00470 [Mammaliicoccus sciuri]